MNWEALYAAMDWKTVTAVAALLLSLTQFGLVQREKWIARRKQKIIARGKGARLFGEDTVVLATQHYVEPRCQESDPAQLPEGDPHASSHLLIPFAKRFLLEPQDRKHLLVLACSGMGKTMFTLNMYAWAMETLPDTKKVAAVPLGSPNADDFIGSIDDPENTVLFLDAFDEDAHARQHSEARFRHLMKLTQNFYRIILTSRTQFFRNDEEIPDASGVAKFGARVGGRAEFELVRRYLSPLSTAEVNRLLRKIYPFLRFRMRHKARRLVRLMPKLSVRPMLLARVPDLISMKCRPSSTWELYEHLIAGWLDRESSWIDAAILGPFSRELAVDLYVNSERRKGEHITQQELREVLHAKQIAFDERLVATRSLLNRDAEGNCKFAHRSIMEFLVAESIVAGTQSGIDRTDQMRAFLDERTKIDFARCRKAKRSTVQRPCYLQGANLRGFGLQGTNLESANLQDANLQGANLQGANLQSANLQGANLVSANLQDANLQGAHLRGARLSRGSWHDYVSELDRLDFEATNLQGANLQGADLEEVVLDGANLRGAKLNGANLERARLNKVDLEHANLEGARLKGAFIGGSRLREAVLKGAILEGARLPEVDLQGANLQEANLEGADFVRGDWVGCYCGCANLQSANLQRANLKRSRLNGVNLEGADLKNAILEHARLSPVTIGRSDINGTNLRNANLEGANLKHVSLSDVSNLEGARLRGACLDGARLDDAVRDFARLQGADLGVGAPISSPRAPGASGPD